MFIHYKYTPTIMEILRPMALNIQNEEKVFTQVKDLTQL